MHTDFTDMFTNFTVSYIPVERGKVAVFIKKVKIKILEHILLLFFSSTVSNNLC